MATTDVSYAGVLLCGVSAPLPEKGLGAAALGMLVKHGGDAIEVERLTTTWVGTLNPGLKEQWGRTTNPSHEPETLTLWQVLRWKADCPTPEYWNCEAYSEAVAKARRVFKDPGGGRVMVTRVVCERLGAITRTGHVYGVTLRRLVEPELSSPAAPGEERGVA